MHERIAKALNWTVESRDKGRTISGRRIRNKHPRPKQGRPSLMTTYIIETTARKRTEIGIFYRVSVRIEADSASKAHLAFSALYEPQGTIIYAYTEAAGETLPIDDLDFYERVMKAAPNADKALVLELIKIAPESNILAVDACNRELSHQEEKRAKKLDKRVEEIGKLLGLKAYRQHDPRGNTIRVVVGREIATSWDGESVGVG